MKTSLDYIKILLDSMTFSDRRSIAYQTLLRNGYIIQSSDNLMFYKRYTLLDKYEYSDIDSLLFQNVSAKTDLHLLRAKSTLADILIALFSSTRITDTLDVTCKEVFTKEFPWLSTTPPSMIFEKLP